MLLYNSLNNHGVCARYSGQSITRIALPKEEERRGAEQSGQATNRALSSQRLVWEQVSGKRKVCKILAERYRNRRRRFGLRLNLLAGLYNLERGRPKCLSREVS